MPERVLVVSSTQWAFSIFERNTDISEEDLTLDRKVQYTCTAIQLLDC